MLSAILSFFLLLLKIIGILLLLLLIIILGVLLLPIRYRLKGEHTEEAPMYVMARITWMLSLIRCSLEYKEEAFYYSVTIFGRTFLSNDPDLKKRRKEKQYRKRKASQKAEGKKKEIEKKDSSPPAEDLNKLPSVEDTIDNHTENMDPKDSSAYHPTRLPSDLSKTEEEASSIKKKNPFKKKKQDKKDRKKGFKKKKAEKKATKKTIEKRIADLKQTMEEYQIMELIRLAKKAAMRSLKHVMPRKLSGWLHLGFDDPSLTGKITAVAAMFYPVYGKQFSFEPDFYDSCLEGKVDAKGRVQIGFFLWILIDLLTKKEVRRVIRLALKK